MTFLANAHMTQLLKMIWSERIFMYMINPAPYRGLLQSVPSGHNLQHSSP